MSRYLVLLFFVIFAHASQVKTPSDVFSYATLLKQKVEYLRKNNNINRPFPDVSHQKNKYPRHVLQKALEILNKINLYRITLNYGPIFIPPYPTRDITPTDVYEFVKRLDAEVTPLIDNEKYLSSLKLVKFKGKTPNDVYRLLWSISLAFDDLLGVNGYTPTDVYTLAQKLLENVKFLRETQNSYTLPKQPKKIPNLYPNHALYKSYDFLKKVRIAQKHLWINNPTEILKKPRRVITPTEVYDSIQYSLAELQRIKYRLGVERYFKIKQVKEAKTPSDVVQTLKYAIELMPLFDLNKPLIQYPQKTLQKTPNHVYAVTERVLKKLNILTNLKGIAKKVKKPPYIAGLKPIHAYQKATEAIEKAIKLKGQVGFFPSQIPAQPLRQITPNEVYERAIRLDGIITILLNRAGYEIDEYIYDVNKQIPSNKRPSDVYNNLWKISNVLDILLATEYTPNETFALSKYIERKIEALLKKLHVKNEAIKNVIIKEEINNKTPKDVFLLTLKLHQDIKRLQDRLNMEKNNITIPIEQKITPNTVYNALRIINANINEVLIFKSIGEEEISKRVVYYKNKTPTDVYKNILKIRSLLRLLYNDKNY